MRPMSALRRFAADTRGTVTVEAVMILPVLLLWYIGSFVFFDVFRVSNINDKAAYTIADMVSRQTDGVDGAYIDGLNAVYDALLRGQMDTRIRVTSITYFEDDDSYRVVWSRATRGGTALDNTSLAAVRDSLPVMPDGETVVLVETFADYTPAIDIGIADQTFTTFIVTRPRFAPQITWSGV